jgi:hypothetical protein
MPPGILGGIAELHISKKDGAILFCLTECESDQLASPNFRRARSEFSLAVPGRSNEATSGKYRRKFLRCTFASEILEIAKETFGKYATRHDADAKDLRFIAAVNGDGTSVFERAERD